MQNEILHEFGLNNNGILIKATDALKGEGYYCPSCKAKLILRKSGRTGKGSRRPHFAHNALKGNCSFESYIHDTFKTKVVEIINRNISNNLPLNLNWKCIICKQDHHINLTGISKAVAEYNMKERIPDIAVFDQNGNVALVIEIVYKHPPEDGAILFYKENNIFLIQIIILSEDDLENVEFMLNNPTSVSNCISPQRRNILPRNPFLSKSDEYLHKVMENPNNYYKKGKKWYPKKYKR